MNLLTWKPPAGSFGYCDDSRWGINLSFYNIIWFIVIFQTLHTVLRSDASLRPCSFSKRKYSYIYLCQLKKNCWLLKTLSWWSRWFEGPPCQWTSLHQKFVGGVCGECLCSLTVHFLPTSAFQNGRSPVTRQVLAPVVEVDLLPGGEVIHQRAWTSSVFIKLLIV